MRKAFLILLIIICILSLSSCSGLTLYSGASEIEDVSLIKTIGIDSTEKGVFVTASSGVGLNGAPPKIYTCEEKTLALALDHFRNTPIGREMIFSHTENILISEDSVDELLEPVIDLVARWADIRLDCRIFIVRGTSAKELITSTASKESSASDMLELLEKHIGDTGGGKVYTFRDVSASLEKSGSALISSIKAEKNGEVSDGASEKMISDDGIAIIEKGKLLSYINNDELLGVSVLTDTLKSVPITLKNAHGENVSVVITDIKTKFKPVFKKDTLVSVNIQAEASANITEADFLGDYGDSYDDGLSKALSEHLNEKIVNAVSLSQNEGVDYLGIGGKLELSSPLKYRDMKVAWDEIFSKMEFTVTVKGKVQRTYDIDEPLIVKGEES